MWFQFPRARAGEEGGVGAGVIAGAVILIVRRQLATLTNRIAQLADPLSAAVIFDERIWNGPAREFILPANPNLVAGGANILRAESLDTMPQYLAEQLRPQEDAA